MLLRMTENLSHPRILGAIQADRWAIQPEALDRIVTIAQGLGDGPEALQAKLGRPLDNTRAVTRRDATAIIPITGPIFRRANLLTEISGATSIETLARDFEQAAADPSIESIILEIDSPGGQVAGISEFAAHVRAATAGKRVVAYVSDLGASAAYWIAAAADEVVARDTARLGSIGVVMQVSTGGKDNAIKFISSQSPKKHAAPDSDMGRNALQAEVDALAQVFIDAVAAYRGVEPETVIEQFGQGGVFVGQSAVDAGLADRLGSLESLIAELNGESPNRRGNTMTAKANTPSVTRELLAAEYPDLLAAITKDGFDSGFVAGAKAERERIQSIEEASLPGHDALIASLKWDGKTTGAEAALQIVKAEKEQAAQRKDRLMANHAPAAPFAVSDPAPTDADKLKAEEARRDKIASASTALFNQVAGVQ
jgi:signal peptide peptidase SppA